MKRLIKTALAATFALVTAVAGAQAMEVKAPAIALRAGPAIDYQVTKQVPAGKVVKVGVCNPVWCHVRVDGNAGWVQTKRILPNFAKTATRGYPAQNRNGGGAAVGGGGAGGGGNLTIRIRIDKVNGKGARQVQTNKVPAQYLKTAK